MNKFSKPLIAVLMLLSISFTPFENKVHAAENPSTSIQISQIDTNGFLSLLQANKGKLILVNFFASWCPPCVEEVPDFVKIANKYPDKEIMIVGLSLDEDPKALQKFMKEHDVNYPVFYASPKLAAAYKVYSIPQNIVYDKKLKTIYNEVGIITYDEIVEMLNAG